MTKLRVTLVQSYLYWEEPEKNRAHLETLLSSVKNSNLIVLPELFSTAFSVSCEGESMNGASIRWMSKMAKNKNASILGSLIISEEGNKYNRLIWMNADGSYYHYDKRHLFGMMNEGDFFKAGKERLIIDFMGWKICPLICYDLRFPVFSRNDESFDLLIYVANWPVRRIEHWKKLLFARAIENQCYVVGVNRLGHDANGVEFNGQSTLIDFQGNTIYSAADVEGSSTIIINKENLITSRERLPFLKDMDSFTIS